MLRYFSILSEFTPVKNLSDDTVITPLKRLERDSPHGWFTEEETTTWTTRDRVMMGEELLLRIYIIKTRIV